MRLVEGLKRNAARREVGMLATSCYAKMFFTKDVKLLEGKSIEGIVVQESVVGRLIGRAGCREATWRCVHPAYYGG